ncbi:MAG: hypothetical protein GY756_15230 [bacterium]|nr:hypothetical protein [bacterium]
MYKKNMNIFLFIVFSLFTSINIFGSKTYSGTVVPIIKNSKITVGSNSIFNGLISYVASVGSILKPEIKNLNNEVVFSGNPAVIMDGKYWKQNVVSAKAALMAAKADLQRAIGQYKRDALLVKTHSVSVEEYEISLSAYYDCRQKVALANAALIQAIAVYNACIYTVPYDAIVEKVLVSTGPAVLQPEVVEISQLAPIFVNIKMSREEANKIRIDTPVTVYPLRGKKEMGVFHGFSKLTKDGINFIVDNYPVKRGYVEVNNKKALVVKDIETVLSIDTGDKKQELGVSLKVLYRDSKGIFVWKAKGVKNMQVGKGIDEVTSVQKIYVKPGDYEVNIAGFLRIKSIYNNPDLQEFDVVLSGAPVTLKDGDLIYFSERRYIFMPDDQVKVVIGE